MHWGFLYRTAGASGAKPKFGRLRENPAVDQVLNGNGRPADLPLCCPWLGLVCTAIAGFVSACVCPPVWRLGRCKKNYIIWYRIIYETDNIEINFADNPDSPAAGCLQSGEYPE